MSPAWEIHRTAERYVTESPAATSWHAFASGRHYDPANTHHGLLVAHDEHLLAEGPGFTDHAHRGVAVVSVVLAGEVVHEDSLGGRAVLGAGAVGVLHAGDGVRHSERARGTSARMLQMWLLCDAGPPHHLFSPHVDPTRGWTTLLADDDAGLLRLACPGTALRAASPAPGDELVVPDAPAVHLTVLTGEVVLPGVGVAVAGDTVRGRAAGEARLQVSAPAELLLWTMPEPARPE